MNYQNKTKEVLIKELQKLRQEYDSLKTTYEKEITERKQAEEALKFTRLILDNAVHTMAIIDYDGHFIDVNIAFCRSVGYSREELLSMTVHDIDPLHPAATWSVFWEKLKQAGLLTFESLHRTKEGKIIPVEINVSFFEHNGKEYHCGFARDITERKQADDALRLSEMKLKTLFEILPIGVSILDAERNIAFVNPALGRILNMTKDSFIRGDYKSRKYLRPDGTQMPEEEFASVRAIREQRAVHNVETGVLMEDGHVIWTNVNAAPVALSDWKVVIITTDITERKQAEEALHLEKENFRHSLDDSPLGVRIVSAEGNTIYANQAIINIYGYDNLGELQKTPLKKRYTPESYAEAQIRKYQRKHGDFSATEYEISIVRKNGEIRHLQVYRKEVLWNGVWQFQIIYEDITERKQAEEEIKKSKKLLEDLHKHLTEIRENERALISREIHDELGQSMTALKLDLNRMNKYLSTNPEAMMKLKSMIELVSNTIKDVQRISSDLRPGILDELGLVSAIEWYCDEFEKRTGIKCNLKLDNSDFSDSQITLTFFRVLQETLTNVIRHAKASSVKVKLKQSIQGTILTVQDNGIGITKEQIKSNKSLGLVSMHERVRQFNGTIDIFSEKGDGTKLTIFIPS
jgi:PAS domain S-box-containing protein